LFAKKRLIVSGTMVPLGTVIQVVEGFKLTPEARATLSEAVARQQDTEVTLTGGLDTVVTVRLLDWLPQDEASRLRTTLGLSEPFE